MMGKKQSKFPLMEKFKLENKTKEIIQKTEFWITYYRHNNYFYDNNKELLRTVRKDNTKKGLENLIMRKSKSNDTELLKKLFSASGLLSHWGVRSVSLNDVIRYMIFLNFDLDVINRICNEITNAHEKKMDKKLAYKVFRETEDEFSLRNYIEIEETGNKIYEKTGGVADVVYCFEKVYDYLNLKEKFEVALTCKSAYSELRGKYFDFILKNCEFDQETRVKIWWNYIPEVSNFL